jgi:hypothetical protein
MLLSSFFVDHRAGLSPLGLAENPGRGVRRLDYDHPDLRALMACVAGIGQLPIRDHDLGVFIGGLDGS